MPIGARPREPVAKKNTCASAALMGRRPVSVLVIESDAPTRDLLRTTLEPYCALVEAVDSIGSAEALRHRCHFDLFIVGLSLPDRPGVDWLQSLRDDDCSGDVIFTADYADLDTAIAALRAGAADLVLKPLHAEQILGSVKRCLRRREMLRENFLQRRRVVDSQNIEGIVGHSEALQALCRLVNRIAPTASTVLLQGETGTGKELIARAIHQRSGREGRFVAVNCGSITAELLESELFGHTKGAFTGAHSARDGLFTCAHKGTILLDEISEMPFAVQAKLLRVLEEKALRPVGGNHELPVDCRVIAATNRPLAERVAQGEFREDLFYRLNVLRIAVPALREHAEDIPELVDHLCKSLSEELGVPSISFSDTDVEEMMRYAWPGNVRELRNIIERSLLLGKLPNDCLQSASFRAGGKEEEEGSISHYPLSWTLEAVERQHILRVLESVGGNKSEAARHLGVSRKTLTRKLSAWNHEEGASQ